MSVAIDYGQGNAARAVKGTVELGDKALFVRLRLIKQVPDNFSKLFGQIRWYCIPYLNILLGTAALEIVVVGKGLYPGSFPDCHASALFGIGVYEVVSIF